MLKGAKRKDRTLDRSITGCRSAKREARGDRQIAVTGEKRGKIRESAGYASKLVLAILFRANSGVKRAFRQIREIKPSSFAATAGRKCRGPRHIFIKYTSRRNQPCTLAAFEGECRVKFCPRAQWVRGFRDIRLYEVIENCLHGGAARCPRA